MNESDVDAVIIKEKAFRCFGKEYLEEHPLLADQLQYTPHWILSDRDGVEYELYWRGCVLVCSKGTVEEKLLVKSVTVDQPIQQAMIASMCNEKQKQEHYIVIISDVNIHFYSFLGQDISRALPFHGAVIWPLSPGLLIHRKQHYTTTRSDSFVWSTVTLLNPLDEFLYIQTDSAGGGRESVGRDSLLDSTYNIISVIANDGSKLLVTSCKNRKLNVWKLKKMSGSATHHKPATADILDIEALKSKLGLAVFTPHSLRSNTTKVVGSKQQVHRERTPSTNVSSFLQTLPNMTTGYCATGYNITAADTSGVNNTLLSTTRYSTFSIVPGYYLTKVYSDKNPGNYNNVRVIRYESYTGDKYMAFLYPSTSTLECMEVYPDDSLSSKKVAIPCNDMCYMSRSKFLVVIHPAGLVYLYDGINQVARLILHDHETSTKPANKKQRKRSSSEDILSARITAALPEAFTLQEQSGHIHYCVVPVVARTPIIRSVLGCIAMLESGHTTQYYQTFYTILVKCLSRENRTTTHYTTTHDTQHWQTLQEAILQFIGIGSVPVHSTITLHDAGVRRTRHSQTNEDWEFLLNERRTEVLDARFGLPLIPHISIKENLQPVQETTLQGDTTTTTTATTTTTTTTILTVLHMLHTEYLLHVHNQQLCQNIAALIYHIALAGGYWRYVRFYRSYYPYLGSHTTPLDTAPVQTDEAPLISLSSALISILGGRDVQVDLLPQLTPLTEAVIILFHLIAGKPLNNKSLKYLGCSAGAGKVDAVNKAIADNKYSTLHDNVLLAIVTLGLDVETVTSLPSSVQLPLLDVLYLAHCNPPAGLPPTAYQLIHRTDVISAAPANFMHCEELRTESGKDREMSFTSPILDFRFPEDKRACEANRMFSTSLPVKIVVERRPDMTDAEHVDQQELLLFNKTKRTMALPVGKALFTFGTFKPTPRDPIVIPDVCISGKALPRGNTVTLDLDIPADMTHWSEFHSGVSTGLRIDPLLSDIDSQWIVYNRPQDLNNKHAGFLFALGLTGHLKKLSSRNLHDYLCQRHKFTSIGLLLGLGVTNRGTQDETITKLFSIHIPALLPPTAVPLELDQLVQTAAIAALGLVYIGSAHRRMAEILLDEIGRSPGPEMDNSEDREGYSLACGFSLGLILLALGNKTLPGLDDLKLTDRLYKYMHGGKKDPVSSVPPSFRIWEGNMINTNVSSIGATVALGLTFLKTGNKNIARTLAGPHTEFLLEGVRPDLLLLRTVCYGLIMWHEILPTTDWISTQIPEVLLDCLDVLTGVSEDSSGVTLQVDPETAFPCTLTIIAGGCFALALRFAGTGNKAAFNTILFYLNTTHRIGSNPADYAGFSKDLTEMCLVSLLVSCSIVMAGTGNLVLMKLIRKLRRRIVPVNTYGHNFVTYGCHMAIHMSLGLLFLGGGRYTLRRDNEAIAALFLSFYPIFQTCQDDNTYHLQAFRHLWVIAAQPRLLITVDEDTNEPCYVPVTITTTPDCVLSPSNTSPEPPRDTPRDTPRDISRTVFTPVMLPEFATIRQLSVIGERYWPVVVSSPRILGSGFIYVKKRTGYLEYKDDPEGKINLLGRTFGDRYTRTIIDTIQTFSKDEKIILFAEKFCCAPADKQSGGTGTGAGAGTGSGGTGSGGTGSGGTGSSIEFCKEQLLACLLEEKTQYLPHYITLYKTLSHLLTSPSPLQTEQIRVILGFYANRKPYLIPDKLLAKLKDKLDLLSDAVSSSEPEPSFLLEELKQSAADKFYSIVGDDVVVSHIAEDIAMKHSKQTVLKFLELIKISGY